MFASVVISTYNRAAHLEKALEAWANQDFPTEDFEVIVVNNGSTDNTGNVVHEAQKKFPRLQLRYFFEERPSLSHARNKGIEEARGEYIIFVDDDATPRKDYLVRLKKYVSQFKDIQAFGGPVLPRYETGKEPAWMNPYIRRIISIVDLGDKPKEFAPKYPVGCNMIFKRELFDKVGKFEMDNLRSEDKHMFLKIKRAGEKVWYLPDIPVRHHIDAYRLKADYIKKVSRLNGWSDRIMLGRFPRSRRLLFKHFTGLVFKLMAAVILWIKYAMQGQGIKGKFLFLSMWHTLAGFVSGQKKKTD